MESLQLSVVAGALEAHGLANAGARDMLVEGGAAGVRLDFGARAGAGSVTTLTAADANVIAESP